MSFGRFYAPDETLTWTLRPNHQEHITTGEYSIQVRTNWLGCRGKDHHAAPADDGATTILILGDSFMFGNGVGEAETMAAQLEAFLRDAPPNGAGYRVVNAGVPGYGPLQYRLRYEKLRNKVQPSAVIIALYLGNDVFDCVWDKSVCTVVDGYLVSREGSGASAARFWAKRNIHLYRLLSRVTQRLRAQIGVKEQSYHSRLASLFTGPDAHNSRAANDPWIRYEGAMSRLVECMRADGIEPLVVLLPMRLQLHDSLWAQFTDGLPETTGSLSRFLPQERTARLLDGLGVRYVDLAPAFLEVGESELFFPLDGHWKPRGHEVAARAVAEYLKRRSTPESHPTIIEGDLPVRPIANGSCGQGRSH